MEKAKVLGLSFLAPSARAQPGKFSDNFKENRKRPGWFFFFFPSLVLALTVANVAQSRAASWSSCCLPRSCLPRAADAHSRRSDVGMELDQICLFIHEMAWLAKTRTRWGTVGDPWAHTPCFFFLAARMRVCRCPDRGPG